MLVVDFLFYPRGGEDDDRRSGRVSWRSVESETRGGGGRKQATLAGWSSRSAGGLKGGIQKIAEWEWSMRHTDAGVPDRKRRKRNREGGEERV